MPQPQGKFWEKYEHKFNRYALINTSGRLVSFRVEREFEFTQVIISPVTPYQLSVLPLVNHIEGGFEFEFEFFYIALSGRDVDWIPGFSEFVSRRLTNHHPHNVASIEIKKLINSTYDSK